jgi:hypothetical protein
MLAACQLPLTGTVLARGRPGKVLSSVVGPRRPGVVPPRCRDAALMLSSCDRNARKFWFDLRSGYFSLTASRRPSAPDSWFWGVLELLIGISELGGIELYLHCLGPRFHHGGQHVLLLFGIALHGGDEVGDEVGAALVVVLHVRP